MLGILIVGYSEAAKPYLEGRDDPSYWENAVPGRGVVVYEAGVNLAQKVKLLRAKGASIVRVNEDIGSVVFTIPEKSVEATRAFLDELLKDCLLYTSPSPRDRG